VYTKHGLIGCQLKEEQIFVVISVTCDRTFSKLSIIKNKLRNTMSQNRLNSLLFLLVEQKMTADVNI